MNQVYRVVFNRSLGVWQCVSEIAKVGGKSSGKVAKPLVVAMSLLACGIADKALAVEYTSSTTITDNPYVVINDTIDGKDTIVNAQDMLVGDNQQGKLTVQNTNAVDTTYNNMVFSPTLNASKITLGLNQGVTGTLNIQDTHAATESVTTLPTNVAGDLLVGVNGTGNLNIAGRSVLKVGGNLIAGGESSSSSNFIQVAANDNKIHWNTQIIVDKDIIIGDKGNAKLEVNSGNISAQNQFILGNQQGSYGELLNTAQAGLAGGNTTIIGNEGTGLATIYNGSLGSETTIIGALATGKGTVNIIGDGNAGKTLPHVGTKKFIIGDAGQGEVNVSGLYDSRDNSWNWGVESNSVIIGNQKGSQGTLNLGDGAADIEGNLIVGNEGSATLNATNGFLNVGNIIRNTSATQSNVILDNTHIEAAKSQSNFFAGFDASTPIQLKTGGVNIETSPDGMPTDISINPNAVITGNAGQINTNNPEAPLGGFVKVGEGTLEMSANTMQWTGDTIASEGVIKVNGDYTLKPGNRLGITLFDSNGNGTLADDAYGKFVFTNKADISQGGFYVLADKAIETTPNTSVWKDVVTAGTLVGQFKQVEDNSPLVDFYADYSDPNKVHLQMIAPPTPTPIPTPTPVPVPTPQPTPIPTPTPVPVPTPQPTPIPTPTPVPVPTPQPTPIPTPTPAPVPTPQPTSTPTKSTTFVRAVTANKNLSTLDLASVLDGSIDSKIATGTNALADNLIKNTLNYNQAQLSKGTSELQPLFIGSVNRMVVDSNNLATNAIIEQSTKRERNVWAKAVGTQSTKDHDGKIMGYKAKDAGIIAGADTAVNDKLNLGMAVSYLHTDADSDGHPIDHEMTAKNWQVLGYGDYQATDATRANFHVGAGQSDIKGERHIKTFGQTTAKSDYNVDTFQAGMGVSHRIGTEQRNVAPFAQVNYVQAKSDSYHETGAGAFNLDVKKHTYNSLRSTLGVNVKQPLTQQVALTGTLAGALENGDPRTDITASFAGTPNTTFVTKGREVGKEVGIAGVGLSYKPSALTEASINYMGEWRKDYDSQGVSLIFSKKF